MPFTSALSAVDLCKPGTHLIVRNAKIDMFRTSMRLAVDQWGKLEEADELDIQPNVRTSSCELCAGSLSAPYVCNNWIL